MSTKKNQKSLKELGQEYSTESKAFVTDALPKEHVKAFALQFKEKMSLLNTCYELGLARISAKISALMNR